MDTSTEKISRASTFSRIDEARLKSRMTMADLADEVGVSQSAVSQWKKTGQISLEAIVHVAEALDVTVDWLLGRTETGGPGDPTDGALVKPQSPHMARKNDPDADAEWEEWRRGLGGLKLETLSALLAASTAAHDHYAIALFAREIHRRRGAATAAVPAADTAVTAPPAEPPEKGSTP